ncbi:MAG: transcriptional repressor [Candidatus Doudnabacteria bacterium]|nr:transcriptional repressor [Candidatus Doudnabacteria bacterium]
MQKHCLIHKEKITNSLKSGKLKVTPIRVKLLDILEHAERPVRVKDIIKAVKSDIATVYRNLESLMKIGLVSQVFLDQKEAYFEPASDGHHHHAICENCGRVSDIYNLDHQKIEKLALRTSDFSNFNRHSLEFFGICKSCANRY